MTGKLWKAHGSSQWLPTTALSQAQFQGYHVRSSSPSTRTPGGPPEPLLDEPFPSSSVPRQVLQFHTVLHRVPGTDIFTSQTSIYSFVYTPLFTYKILSHKSPCPPPPFFLITSLQHLASGKACSWSLSLAMVQDSALSRKVTNWMPSQNDSLQKAVFPYSNLCLGEWKTIQGPVMNASLWSLWTPHSSTLTEMSWTSVKVQRLGAQQRSSIVLDERINVFRLRLWDRWVGMGNKTHLHSQGPMTFNKGIRQWHYMGSQAILEWLMLVDRGQALLGRDVGVCPLD